MNHSLPTRKKNIRGFSLIELVFATGVLAVAVIGGLAMIVIGVGRNGSNRMDTAATNVAQTVLEDIATSIPTGNPTLNITDCGGNNLAITTGLGGAPVLANGDINFNNAAPAGYQVNYSMCASNGRLIVYDVRWRVDPVAGGTWGKLITVSARQPLAVQNGTMVFIPPVTLRTIVGM